MNPTGLAAGTYNGLLTITAPAANNNPYYVPVTLTLTVTSSTPAIGFSPTSLTFTGTVGSTNPAAKPINISNSGGGTLSWAASDNAAWLTLSPASGTNSGTVTAMVGGCAPTLREPGAKARHQMVRNIHQMRAF